MNIIVRNTNITMGLLSHECLDFDVKVVVVILGTQRHPLLHPSVDLRASALIDHALLLLLGDGVQRQPTEIVSYSQYFLLLLLITF